MRLDRADAPVTEKYATVYIAFELSKAKWLVGVIYPGSDKMSRYSIPGGNLGELSKLLSRARERAAHSGKPVRILSCYEAGIDGFDRDQIEATILECWGLENGNLIRVDSKPSPKGEKVLIEAAEVMSCDRLETA